MSGDAIKDYMDSRFISEQRVDLHVHTHEVGRATYQYDPLPTITQDIAGIPGRGGCSGAHTVVSSWRRYNVSFGVYQDFKGGGVCHDLSGLWWVEDNTNVGSSCSHLTKHRESVFDEGSPFCQPEMLHEVQKMDGKNYTTRSFIDLSVVPGAANPTDSGLYPYQKTLVVQFGFAKDASRAELVLPLFVEGEKLLGSSFSMDFPQSLPILIVHDPPGGGSSAFFKEASSISTSISMSTSMGGSVSAKGTIKGGYEQKEELCLGIGVTKCSSVLTTSATAYASISASVGGATSERDGWSFGLSEATSYSTTGYSGMTGRDADAVLTTAINIKFGMSKEVLYNETSCAGYDRDSVQVSQVDVSRVPQYSTRRANCAPLSPSATPNPSHSGCPTVPTAAKSLCIKPYTTSSRF